MNNDFTIESFITTYFKQNNCAVTVLQDGLFEIQLTEEIDRVIMNRPFYWHYMKTTGRVGDPQQLTLRTTMDETIDQAEWIHFGTPRMNDICQHLEQSSRFIKAFQRIDAQTETLLQPWLIINGIISYSGKQKKEETISIGLNLINGVFIEQAMDQLYKHEFAPFISPLCFTVNPLIKIRSGFKRIEGYISEYLNLQNYKWVTESLLLLKEELLLLKHFYHNSEQKSDLKREAVQLCERLQPEVNFSVINGGIFYMTKAFAHK